jgi:hypothetical protein
MEFPHLKRFWKIACHKLLLSLYSDGGLYRQKIVQN